MEDLIKQAFLQVDVLGPHVQEGHYDLIGPSGEIILPSVWDSVIQPDWSITMTMWPLDKHPTRARGPPGRMPPGARMGPAGPMGPGPRGMPVPPPDPRSRPPGEPHGVNPPPGWIPRDPRGRHGPPDVEILNVAPKPKHKSSKKDRDDHFLKFFAGSSKPKKKKK